MEITVHKNRWIMLMVVLVGTLMATLDSSIVNVALPVMSKHLKVGLDSIQWVVTSYLIVISAFIVIFGKIADKIGKTKVFLTGFLIFGVGSLLCGVSNNLGLLVFSRIFQAVGASMFMSTNQGIVAATFPPNERGRALGFTGTTVAFGTMLGPVLGGIMVQYLNWQSVFLINIPIAIFGYIAGIKVLPKDAKSEEKFSLDCAGSTLFVIFIVSLFWSILSGEKIGWGGFTVITGFTVGIASLVVFIIVERRVKDPMLDLTMFKNGLFTVSLICAFLTFVATFSTNIIHPFYLQYVIKATPAQAGLLMIVSPICIAFVAPLSGHLSDKIGSELLTCVGLTSLSTGLVLMSFLNEHSTYADIVMRVALLGIGSGMFQSPNTSLIMATVGRDKLGIAGSINALTRNVGMATGIAFSVALLYNRMSTKVGYRVTSFVEGQNTAFLYGMRTVYISAACVCLIGVILTLGRMLKKKERTAAAR